ncbi:MAG: IPT/TIG domain-containing protein [Ilumatobacteraceae bacterium]
MLLEQHHTRRTPRRGLIIALAALASAIPILALAPETTSAVAGAGTISGEIERIFLNTPGDVYAGGQLVVGGQNVIIPRNLLLDLPANRLTLQQLFAQAPADCQAVGETGLAKTDTCNASGTGALITISANRVASGDIIAGDVLVEKGVEAVTGSVTYINYTDGYFRVNGRAGDPTTGVMVRLNDPNSRHTVQQGLGCLAGSSNCSADPRFALDPDNYTNAFTSGYPLCIPSTVPRAASTVLAGIGPNPGADANGSGDRFCPLVNRGGRVAADSRFMAPILLGDPITAEGNFETIGGVTFLSAHSTTVSFGLQTSAAADQPNYMFLEEAFIDVAGFQNQRARALFIGFATDVNPDIMGWSIHYDPELNEQHEMPLASTNGCNAAGGGCTGFGTGLFKIKYDSDFLVQPTSPKLSPCSHINFDPRFGTSVCPGGNSASNEFGILSPVPHEIHFRTGKKVADVGDTLKSIDITGAESTNGQYLFPFGANLGGINFPEALEFNLDLANQPFSFEGIPWDLDRRLSPGGCQAIDPVTHVAKCESTPQPLDPFPFSEQDPRLLAGGAIVAGGAVPTAPYNDGAFTSAPLSSAADRILSYIPFAASTRFGGDASVLSLPTAAPAAQGITPTPRLTQSGPAVLGIDPASGKVGSTLHIGGLGIGAATAVTVNGVTALFSVVNAARIDVTVPSGATGTGQVVVTLPSGALAAPTNFTVTVDPLAPTLTSFSPLTGDTGSTVTIAGTNFTGATAVFFGTTAAAFTVVNATTITATVPLGLTAGAQAIRVVNANGSITSSGTFAVTVPPPPPAAVPTVTATTPTHALVGSTVTITGTGFIGATGVSFNGTAQPTFTVVNGTTIQTAVPTGATSGVVTVTNAQGPSVGGASFTVDAPVQPLAKVAQATVNATQGGSVQLDGSTSTDALTYSWTQVAGSPTVQLTGANTAKPTFTFPSAFVNLTFRLTVTNGPLTSTKDVVVKAIPGIVTIAAGTQVRTTRGEWRGSGTASFPGANTVTVRTGSVVGSGTVVAVIAVDATGAWTLNVRGSTVPASTSINVVASRGGSSVAAVAVRA